MDQFHRILVCVNDPGRPDPALDCGVQLAKANRANLTLVYAGESDEHFWQTARIRTELQRAREEWLEQLRAKVFADLPDVRTKVLDGRPAVAISQEVVAGAHDLVIKTSQSDRFSTRLFFGSTSIRLIRMCPCPVWILQPEGERFDKIVAAVDPFAASGDESDLNVTIVRTAASLADEHFGQLHVVGVIPDIKESPLVPGSFKEEIRRYRADTARLAGENMLRLMSHATVELRRERLHCLSGHPGDAIGRFVAERDFDLVVLGTVAQSGRDGVRIGGTTERVLHAVKSSVFAIKPESFVANPPMSP